LAAPTVPNDLSGGCASAQALPDSGLADLGHQFGNVLLPLGEQLTPTNLSTHRILQELRGGKVTLFHQLVEIVWEIDLHTWHTPKYTPSRPSGKRLSHSVHMRDPSTVLSRRQVS
jgi:hypothetical protein